MAFYCGSNDLVSSNSADAVSQCQFYWQKELHFSKDDTTSESPLKITFLLRNKELALNEDIL